MSAVVWPNGELVEIWLEHRFAGRVGGSEYTLEEGKDVGQALVSCIDVSAETRSTTVDLVSGAAVGRMCCMEAFRMPRSHTQAAYSVLSNSRINDHVRRARVQHWARVPTDRPHFRSAVQEIPMDLGDVERLPIATANPIWGTSANEILLRGL
jgi:hypothetical protein